MLLIVGDVILGRGVLVTPEPFADASNWLVVADLAPGNF